MLIQYKEHRFNNQSLAMISEANAIIADYESQGYSLTLRQLYYQFVARDAIPNTEKSYKRLGALINNARLAGLVSWDAIEDRTRYLRKNSHWSNADDIIESCALSYAIDKWQDQEYMIEVWVEKTALIGIVAPVCERLDVPYFACIGYPSASEVHSAAMRHKRYWRNGQSPVVIHLGDHDPSGIDMTRDLEDRFNLFFPEFGTKVIRIALNRDQIDQYKPPPNPAKMTDSRFAEYVKLHGRQSWELDALNPSTLAGLIESEILYHRDDDLYAEKEREEAKTRNLLMKASENWHALEDILEEL